MKEAPCRLSIGVSQGLVLSGCFFFSLFTCSLHEAMSLHGFSYHSYVDDTQLILSSTPWNEMPAEVFACQEMHPRVKILWSHWISPGEQFSVEPPLLCVTETLTRLRRSLKLPTNYRLHFDPNPRKLPCIVIALLYLRELSGILIYNWRHDTLSV